MIKKLRDDDANAVDLLMDRENMNSDEDGGLTEFAGQAGDSVSQPIGRAESLFHLLAQMPAAEPSADLMHRTLERIQLHDAASRRSVRDEQPSVMGDKPQHDA